MRCPHPAARLVAALALCDRGPCSAALFLPQAARGSAAFDKIYPKTAHSSRAPRTQFWGKFPWMCLHRRHMSADGDGFSFYICVLWSFAHALPHIEQKLAV
ncbi:hypothetical protein SUBVAR_07121 [Subdoligranulum variabile DSM 15176]|uniref:Secreted protein n=1 Tax=Subdoligranulum variabile DSM 15176 TaxID=411471 RepID=D1PRN6_9FIRM|nr:hypothetical protein SUBVAR_07121 [Subdoligranulum variabile DSM 15176]